MLQTQQTKKKNSSIFNYPTTNKKMITKIKEDFILLSGKEKENDAPLIFVVRALKSTEKSGKMLYHCF